MRIISFLKLVIKWFLENAALIAALGTILTLIFLLNQHKTSIKPEIVVNNVGYTLLIENYIPPYNIGFYITDDKIDTSILRSFNSVNVSQIDLALERNSLYIIPRNIGLGVAKEISYSWEFNKDELLSIFLSVDKVDVYFDTAYLINNKINFFSDNDSTSYSFYDLDKIGKINYILPIGIEKANEMVKIKLPYSYIEMYALYCHFKYHIKFESELKYKLGKKFPDLYLNLNYKDISNNKVRKTYIVQFSTDQSSVQGGTIVKGGKDFMKFIVNGNLKLNEVQN